MQMTDTDILGKYNRSDDKKRHGSDSGRLKRLR